MKKLIFTPLNDGSDIKYDPPTSAVKHIPDWFKNTHPFLENATKVSVIPKTSGTNSTIKRCVPFLDAFSIGYTCTLADDVIVTRDLLTQQPMINWRTSTELITSHSSDQVLNLPFPDEYDHTIFKFSNEWLTITPEKYSLFFTHPVNRFDLPFYTFSGFVDTFDYPMSVQFPFMIKKTFSGIIEKGTPIAQFFPIKLESWQSELQEYNKKEREIGIRQFFGKIDRTYKSQWWNKKSYQ